jgi:hypothetical protein
MTKVLVRIFRIPAVCSFSISFGIGVMLSVAYLDPSNSSQIVLRHVIGGLCLLAPGIAQRFGNDEQEA